MAVRARRPNRFVDVAFRQVVADPVSEAERVMATLGLPVDRAAFAAYLERNQAQRHGSHTYTAADFGLSEAELQRDFAFYEEVMP
jgi:hypothetical protein